VFTSEGEYSYSIGTDISGLDPRGIGLDSNNNIYVADAQNHCIHVFTSSGNYSYSKGTCGSSGSAAGQFDYPVGIGLDSEDSLYVTEEGNDRVQVFTSSGEYSYSIGTGTSGDAPGQFNNPYGVDVDSNGLIYVSDSQNSRIQVFTASGAYIYSFGQSIMPIKLKIHNNKAYVADSQNDCIMIYDIPKSQTTTHTVATGNVGIGTSSPTEKLEVDGNVKINNNLILANGASSVSQTILKAMSQSEARTITLPDTSGVVVVTDDGNITIPDGSVTTAKLADASVTAAKLAGNPGTPDLGPNAFSGLMSS
jgi:hypothetical protein